MSYGIGQPVLWPCPPHWSEPVTESLAWLTDIITSRTGTPQKRQLRMSPRRSFSFTAKPDTDVRRLVDAIGYHSGARQIMLPIYSDGQGLTTAAVVGASKILSRVQGFDFSPGGQAVLWRDALQWELVGIEAVQEDGLLLTAALDSTWPVGTRLYPVRAARFLQPPQETMECDDASVLQLQFLIDEPCDWPKAWPSAIYRSLPVLEWRPDESTNPTGSYTRTLLTVGNDTGPTSYFDLPGVPFRVQSQQFTLWGRDEQARFRSLLYALAGRAGQIWVPSWNQDLVLHAAAGSLDATLQVKPAGYSIFGLQQVNRRDLRIELYGGTVLYRRITDCSDDGDYETLTLDSALGVAFSPAQVRCISFMSMCQLAADEIQISHSTDGDGEAICQLSWQAVKTEITYPVAGFGLAFGRYFGGVLP